ncbi:NADPH:quinone oxidoreductase family protein [Pseudonocardia spinosispora]|uniref:NADPH:quinone oxidoreductase family protein n=1 Tax=Pseudonocardia spinosispora TaxID=103441 RepID=UPI00040CC5E2|nr:NADPH:quinone oxidoreductase family protein [Pseudonocardia spinosispora]
MKSWVSHEPGGPEALVLEDVPVPTPGQGDVLVRVRAVGINFPDSLLIRGQYQVSPPRPLTPGSEFCGDVEATRDHESGLKPGDRVIGVSGWGAMAEYVTMPARALTKAPDSLPYATGAAFLFTYATAYHALRDVADLQAEEKLVVLGAAGGVGRAAVELGRALGATVVAGVSSAEKLDFALAAGATSGIVYDAELGPGGPQRDFTGRLRALDPAGTGFDVVFDPVGGSYSEPAFRALGRGGRHLVVGFAAGIPRIPLNLVLLKGASIIGVDWRTFVEVEAASNRRNVGELLALWGSGSISPAVTHIIPFSDAPSALALLDARKAMGKIVVMLPE